MAGDAIHDLGFPEALRWREGALWCSDMFRSRVLRWRPGSAVDTVLDRAGGGPVQPGGLGWLPDGTLLVVDCLERRLLGLAPGAGAVHVHADLTAHIDRPANDLHVDADGTAWVGSNGFDPATEAPRPVPLLRVDPEGNVERTARTFVFPNGMERAADGSLVIAETFADRLSAMAPAGTTTTVALDPGSGPDGLSIGPDGTVYVALAFGGALVAVPPTGPDAIHGDRPRVIHRAGSIADGPAAGPLAIYDCAVTPDGRRIAVASASLDEDVAMRHDTGRVELIDLPGVP